MGEELGIQRRVISILSKLLLRRHSSFAAVLDRQWDSIDVLRRVSHHCFAQRDTLAAARRLDECIRV
jgi:hypothetical protein